MTEYSMSGQLSPVQVACLTASKARGLIRKQGSKVCPLSRETEIGWWARSNYSDHGADSTKGGPWSVETVAHLCGLGLLGVHPDTASKAALTKAGTAAIRKPKATQSISSSTCGIAVSGDETLTSNKEGKTNG